MTNVRTSTVKRALAIVAASLLCVAAIVLAGCGSSSSSSAAASSGSASASASSAASSSAAAGQGTREFTDSLGRTVEIPANIERVAVSGAISQHLVLLF